MPRNSHFKIFFEDRFDAANQLMDTMPMDAFKKRDVMVIALSNGGIEIADQIARKLEAPMDILLSDAVPAPNNTEYPIAMISETQTLVMNRALIDAFEIDEDYVYSEAKRCYEDQVLSHVYRYRHGEPIRPVAQRVVLLVDECVETGLTALMGIKSMLEQEATNVYLAVPILDETVHTTLIQVCDGIFSPHKVRDYISVEYYYQEWKQTPFETIERIMEYYE